MLSGCTIPLPESLPADAPAPSTTRALKELRPEEPAPTPPPVPSPAPQWSEPKVEKRTIQAGGLTRSYIVSFPPGAPERQRLPLIFVFHGFEEDAQTIHEYSGMDQADAVVVYMEGEQRAWSPAPYAATTGEQDLAFVDAVLAALSTELSVDRARVFAAGLSNGGGFAAYLGCQRPQEFTAVATVAAAFYEKVSQGCSAIPMKHIDFHGTADQVINYSGGERHETVYESTDELLEDAAARNRCNPEPNIIQLSDSVTELQWQGCDAGLEHFRIQGGPHVWPGGGKDTSRTVPDDFATMQLLEFFGVAHR